MERLSPDSRYERFHAARSRLSPGELRYLTEIDGIDHVAIGAMEARTCGRGLGVARFVRLPNDPESADSAIVIAEAARRKGLARILTSRLIEAAAERGIRTLVWEILSTNRVMLRLLDSAAPDSSREILGSVTIVRVPVK
jgi:ribosomal protein S18 acetylase RimI-like enzyme